eukprot:g1402.t1
MYGNIVLLLLGLIANIGLFGLVFVTNEASEGRRLYWYIRDLGTHLAFTNVCFIGFCIYEFAHTSILLWDIWQLRKVSPLFFGGEQNQRSKLLFLWVGFGCAVFFNLGLIVCYAVWKASGMGKNNPAMNLWEWFAVGFIWLYFIVIGLVGMVGQGAEKICSCSRAGNSAQRGSEVSGV